MIGNSDNTKYVAVIAKPDTDAACSHQAGCRTDQWCWGRRLQKIENARRVWKSEVTSRRERGVFGREEEALKMLPILPTTD